MLHKAFLASLCLLVTTDQASFCQGQFVDSLEDAYRSTSSIQKATRGMRSPDQPDSGSQKMLTGNVEHDQFDLREADESFQGLRRKAKLGPTFQDFIKKNEFMGNPILIRLKPSDEDSARDRFLRNLKDITTTRAAFASAVLDLADDEPATLISEKIAATEIEIDEATEPGEKVKLEGKLNELRSALAVMEKTKADISANSIDAFKQCLDIQMDKLSEAASSLRIANQVTAASRDGLIDESTATDSTVDKSKPNSDAVFLLILNYNVPALRSSLIPTKYHSVRICMQANARPYKEQAGSGRNLNYSHISILSIYPKMEILDANFSNTKTLELQAKPEYSGAAAGSVTFTNQNEIDYALTFPKAIGIATRAGALQWVYYPAKAQQIAFGNHCAFVVFSVPESLADGGLLQINAMLEYDLKIASVLGTRATREYTTLYCPFAKAYNRKDDVQGFVRQVTRNMALPDQQQVLRLLTEVDPMNVWIEKEHLVEPSKEKHTAPSPAGASGGGSGTKRGAPTKKNAKGSSKEGAKSSAELKKNDSTRTTQAVKAKTFHDSYETTEQNTVSERKVREEILPAKKNRKTAREN